MRKLLALASMIIMGTSPFIGIQAIHAEGSVVQFEIIAPATSRVNEAIDVTVRAVDKDKKVVIGYRGAIIFVPENFGDTVPMPGKSIAFGAEDNGEKKFSKGVIFKTQGKQKISIVDVVDDISGEATVSVEAGAQSSGSTLEEVMIVSPAKNSKITSDVVIVSGKTRKNSKVSLSVNGKDMGAVLSDESGVFTKSISGITQDSNILSASLIDGAGIVIGKSLDTPFSKIAAGPAFYNLTVSPGTKIDVGSKITFLAEAEAGLSEVQILLDGSLLPMKEGTSGKYTLETVAPKKAADYDVSVRIKSPLGQSLAKDNVLKLTTIEPTSSFEEVKLTTLGKRVTFNFGVKNPPADLEKFKIAYGENPESFSNEVMTWNTGKILKADGRYEWYIDNLTPKNYSFKIMGVRKDGTIFDAMVSETLSTTIGSSASCTIGNVGNIKIETLSDKSILTWDSLSGALSYNVYKIAPNGDSTLFQNTKEAQTTIFLASGAVVLEDFGVKALCDTITESADFSKASKVRTGPGMTAILVIISAIIGAVIMRRRSI